jgi:hypothetical protein
LPLLLYGVVFGEISVKNSAVDFPETGASSDRLVFFAYFVGNVAGTLIALGVLAFVGVIR